MERPRNICTRLAVPLELKQQVKIMSFQEECNRTLIAGSHLVCEITFFVWACAAWPQRGSTIALGFFYFFVYSISSYLSVFPSELPCFKFSIVTCRNIFNIIVSISWRGKRYHHFNYSKYLVPTCINSKRFACINSFIPHNGPMRKILLLCPFSRWGQWDPVSSYRSYTPTQKERDLGFKPRQFGSWVHVLTSYSMDYFLRKAESV